MTLQSIVSILHNVVLDGDKKERDQAVKVLKLLAAHDAAHKQADKDAAMNAIKNAQLPVGYSAELISRPLAGTAISEGDFIKVSGKFDDKMNLRIKAAGGAWDRAPAKIAGNPTLVINTVATGSKSWLIPAAKADKFLKQFS